MRFRAGIQNIHTFTKLTTSLSNLGPIAWLRLNDTDIRFTIIPESGTQVWAVLQIDTIFDADFTIQSAAEANTINLEVPLQPLNRALKSAANAVAAAIRLTKKDGVPLLSLTITTAVLGSTPAASSGFGNNSAAPLPSNDNDRASGTDGDDGRERFREESLTRPADRDTTITQDIPVRVLAPASVAGLHEPMTREPDVHIMLPALGQVKGISDRFTKMALASSASGALRGGLATTPKLELSANMHGCLRLRVRSDAVDVSSLWTGLTNPELDPNTVEGGEEGVELHPSTRMKRLGDAEGNGEEGWATVRVDGRDWGRVLGVGRLGGRVIACFCHENALILYVYLSNEHDDTESVLTYYVSSYSV